MLMQFKAMLVSIFLTMGVGDYPIANMENLDDMNDIACLAQAVYGEAGNQSFEGKLAVAHVILNRTKDIKFPDDICAVVRQKSQFNYISKVKYIKESKDGENKQLTDSVKASLKVINGDVADPTFGSLYFVNLKIAKATRWLYPLRKTTSIGDHSFYKHKS